MTEKVEVIEIDTGQSVKTLKSLKDEIKLLRQELDNCEVGSEKFTSTLEELSAAQDELKNATKSTNTALEGSYDALVQKMNTLKKEWRSTADEINRGKLSKEIAEINRQLKDMDAEIGNYQRNVGDYGSAFDDLTVKLDGNTASFERMNTTAQDVIGSFDVVEGGLKAIGVESTLVNSLMDKLNGAMKMTQGFKSIKEGATSFKALSVATKGATVATNGFKKALIATGIGAFVVAVGTLVAYWDDVVAFFEKFKDNAAETKKEIKELNSAIGKEAASEASTNIVALKRLSSAYQQLGDSVNEKNTFIAQNVEELKKMGIEINNIADADEVFIKNTTKYVDALKARAKAQAAQNLIEKEYEEYLIERQQLEEKLEKEQARLDAGITSPYYSVAAEVEKLQKDLDKFDADIESRISKYTTVIDEYNKTADEVLTSSNDDTIKKIQEQQKAIAEKQAAVLEEFRLSQLSEQEKLYDALDKKYQEYLALFKGDTEKQLLVFNWYTEEYSKLVQQQIDAELSAKEQIAKAAEETTKKLAEEDKKRYENAVAASENRLQAKLAEIEKSTESNIYLNERSKPKNNSELANIDNELKKIETLKQIITTVESETIAAIDEEQAKFAEGTARWVELEQQRISVKEQTNRQLSELDEQYSQQHKARTKSIATNTTQVFTAALSSASQIISAIQNTIDIDSKDSFEKNKKLQIVNATISMLSGIVNAISTSMAMPQPFGAIMAGVNAATVATVGGIQIAQIKKQKYDGSSSGGLSTPSINTAALLSTPINYTTEVKDASAVEEAVDTRVYVVESDITSTVKKVQVAEEESTY